MATDEFVELVLTCASWQEAQAVADDLLQQKLVACVEMVEVQSKYSWQHKLEEAKEIKLIMLADADSFDKIEQRIAKLHSYETFVLQQIPLSKLSSKASDWLLDELK